MRRHSQQPTARQLLCPSCKHGDCNQCADVLLARVGRAIGCACIRDGHAQALRTAQRGLLGFPVAG